MKVSRDVLERALGLPAWIVWERMARLRSAEGLFWGSVDRMVAPKGQKPLSKATVKRALQRLAASGLVYQPAGCAAGRPDGASGVGGLGFQTLPVGARGSARRVFVRRVYGDPVATSGAVGHRCSDVPPKTAAWLKEWSPPKHGGARPGSGRRGVGQVPGGSVPMNVQDEPQGEAQLANQDEPQVSFQDEPLNNITLQEPGGCGVGSLRSPTRRDSESLVEDSSAPGSTAPSAATVGGAGLAPQRGSLGVALRAGGRRRVVTLTQPLEGVPAYPSAAVTGSARVPAPPKLDPAATDLQRAEVLAATYRAVVSGRYGERCWTLSGALKRSRHLPMMLAAAATMLEHNIAPAAWVAWSVDLWRRDTGRSMKPPLSWVFGPQRIEKRRGWFSSESVDYSGGRIIYGPKRAALVQSYMAMRREIDVAQAWDAPAAIVKKFFPGNTYDRELGGVRAEVKREQEALRARVEAGEILW